MSTYWFFECLDHEPPIPSLHEFTQHAGDEAFRRGVELARSRPVDPDWWSKPHTIFEYNALRFLEAHPSCRVGLVSEGGDRRSLEGL